MPFRIGFGYDVHQLAEGRKLVLGGVEIPHDKGSVAHSDGDVLIHAICDALLGAAACVISGFIFPTIRMSIKTSTVVYCSSAPSGCLKNTVTG
jgi:2-C-methyl-D-erythritol 2,4-cyclodiphosphate synthase